MINKTNHICKNPNCNKEYYACDACDRKQGILWRQVACSRACSEMYKNLCDEENQKALQAQENKE